MSDEIRDLCKKVLELEAQASALPMTEDGYLHDDAIDAYEEIADRMAIAAPTLARELQRLRSEHADGAWVFAPDLRRALDGKRAVGNDPLVLDVQRLHSERCDLLADADASQHWQTRALRAEAERDEARAKRDDLADQLASVQVWIETRTDAPRTDERGEPLTLIQRLTATRAEVVRAREERDEALTEAKRLRKELREAEEDRVVQGRRDTAMMNSLPNRRFAGGTRVDEMVIQVCAWLREVRPELWTRP